MGENNTDTPSLSRRDLLRLPRDNNAAEPPNEEKTSEKRDQPSLLTRMLQRPIGRKTLLKAGIAAGAAVAGSGPLVGALEATARFLGVTSPSEFVLDGGEAAEYFLSAPEKKQTPLATNEAFYFINNGRGQTHYGNGDSLGLGFTEDKLTGAERKMIHQIWAYSLGTPGLFAAQVNAIAPFKHGEGDYIAGPDVKPNRWVYTNDSCIGWTTAKTIADIDSRLEGFRVSSIKVNDDGSREKVAKDTDKPHADPLYRDLFSDLTWDVSMGGNDVINMFVDHIPEMVGARLLPDRLGLDYRSFVGLKKDFEKFLPKFQTDYTEVLKRMLLEAVAPDGSMKYLKRIFVRGLPDGFKMDHIDLSKIRGEEDLVTKVTPRKLTPAEQQVIGVMTIYMNNAIKMAIEDAVSSVHEQYNDPHVELPDVLFESLDDIELNGIHPTKGGYEKLAKQRLERCTTSFPDRASEYGMKKMSFWERAQSTGKTIALLQQV